METDKQTSDITEGDRDSTPQAADSEAQDSDSWGQTINWTEATSIPQLVDIVFSLQIVNNTITQALFKTLFKHAERLANTFNNREIIDENISSELYQTLSNLCELMETTDYHLLEIIGNQAATEMPQAVAAICNLMQSLFHRLSTGIDTQLVGGLIKSRLLLAGLADHSCKMRIALLNLGMVVLMATELHELKEVLEVDEVLKILLMSTFALLQSCIKDSKSYAQIKRVRLLEILQPYLRCPFDEVRINAKFTVGALHFNLGNEVLQYLEATEEELHQIVASLGVASVSSTNSVRCFGCEVSTCDLLRALTYLAVATKNRKFLANAKFLTVVENLLRKGYPLEQKAVLNLFWLLLKEESMMLKLEDEGAHVIELIGQIESGDRELQLLSSSILWTISPPSDADTESLLLFAEGCYIYRQFEECVSLCDKVRKHPQAKLLKAKALFQLYCSEQQHIAKSMLQPKEFHQKHVACYKKAREVILLLGSLLDSGYINGGHECSKMLDLAMIDYLKETNNLKDCERCLLCRRRAKLQRSHLWPKSLLDSFASGMETSPKSLKIYLVSWEKQGPLRSPKEVTFWMLCANCESLLSGCGESQFVPKFFRKLYDTTCPEQTKKQQSVPYREWLYQFCIGLVFRGLVQRNMSAFTNEEDIYQLFLDCRKCLLNLSSLAEVTKKPDVAVLINPTEPNSPDHGFIYQVLHMAGLFAVEEFNLSDGSLSPGPAAQFFLAHFGIINVIVPFKNAEELRPYFIDTNGGTYLVHEDKLRKIPDGLWSFFEHLAQDFEINWLERHDKLVRGAQRDKPNTELSPTEKDARKKAQETYMFVEGLKIDLKALQVRRIAPSKSGNPRILKFLPKQFAITRMTNQPASVSVPDGHQILLHATFKFDMGSGLSEDTFFLVVGRDGKGSAYTHDKPYILYLRYEEGLQLQVGFFISTENLSAGKFLPDNESKYAISSITAFDDIKGLMPRLLPHIVQQKGMNNFLSFLQRIRVQRKVPVIDLKCQDRCWYCISACESCLKPASLGFTVKSSQTQPIRFCSSTCQSVFCDQFTTPKLTILDILDSGMADEEDRELLRLQLIGTAPTNTNFKITMSLCSGPTDTQPYMLFNFRTLYQQQFVEFFVNNDLSAADPLPYLPHKYSSSLSSLHFVPVCLQQALQTKEYEHLVTLFQGTSSSSTPTKEEMSYKVGMEALAKCSEKDSEVEAHELKIQGNAALKAGKIKEAIDLYSQAIERAPSNEILYSNRSAAFHKLEMYEAALADANKSIELKPDWFKGYFRKGRVLASLGYYTRAEEAYTIALKHNPGSAELERCLKQIKDLKYPT